MSSPTKKPKPVISTVAPGGPGTSPAEKGWRYATYWLTRDTRDGQLSEFVSVWWVRPERVDIDGDRVWTAFLPDGKTALYGQWTVDQARKEAGSGTPDDDRQCTRVGAEDDAPRTAGIAC